MSDEQLVHATEDESEQAGKAKGQRKGLGIAAKLMGAFAVCTMLTVLVSGLAWFNVGRIGGLFEQTVSESVPKIVNSAELGVVANRIAAGMPDLAFAGDDNTRQQALEKLQSGIAALQDGAGSIGATELEKSISDLRDLVAAMDAAVRARFEVEARIAEKMTTVGETAEKGLAIIPPLVTKANIDVISVSDAMFDMADEKGADADIEEIIEAGQTLIVQRVQPLRASLDLQASLTQSVSVLNRVVNETTEEAVHASDGEYLAVLGKLTSVLVKFDDSRQAPVLKEVLDSLIALGSTENGLLTAVREKIALEAQAVELLANKDLVVQGLLTQADAILTSARSSAAEDAQTAIGTVEETKLLSIALGVVAVVVAAAIAWFFVHANLVRRLTAMVASMREIADGNLDADIPTGGTDEIGTIGETLEIFRENSREVQRASEQRQIDRDRAAAERKQAMDSLADNFEQTVSGIVQRVGEMSSIVRGAAESMNATAGTSKEESTEAAGLSGRMNETMQTVSSATEEMAASIGEISQQVSKSVEIAGRAVAEVTSTDRQISDLSKAADEIGSILGIISDIAEQTNLLALNATIEAARAGDAGKGFAVVANEVKSLASQTVKATDQIAQQIASMQASTKGAVQAVSGIGEIVSEIDSISSAIAGAVEEQGAVTQEIARSVSESFQSSTQMAESVNRVANASDQAGQQAGQLLENAAEMTELSGSLSQEIDRFVSSVRA
ncbi:methyl-accepting chemotaxis protein [Hwanghaeella sp.]|uniref:methyl-accepting chemotaxis protein n=1 Tax=Hwanghaeella sp. TaxID=2605943 RepID=UPI003CCB9B13